MAETGEEIRSDLGSIQIAPEVLAVIAGLATVEVDGVAGMSGGIAGGIAELLGRKNVGKGVKVVVAEESATIDVSVIIHFGMRIPEVCMQIQENIQEAISEMTGLHVKEVNVHVLDVLFKPAETKEEEPAVQVAPSVRVR